MNKKGEPFHGGRQVGWRKPEGVRKQRQLRAYEDEWLMIHQFAKIIKYGDKAAAQKFLDDNQ